MSLQYVTVRVACCQVSLAVGDVVGNLARAEVAVRAAVARGANLVVLPELLASGYCLPDLAAARAVAEPATEGPTARLLHQLAELLDIVLVAGVCEDDDGVLYNSALLVTPDHGVRAVYRKAHLWDAEPDLFARGQEPPPVVDTDLGRIAVMICYDLEFPEWVRLAALAGADILAVPANWPRGAQWPDGERPAEVTKALAAAATNGMAVAVCDRAGGEVMPARMAGPGAPAGSSVEWIGGSLVADQGGAALAVAPIGPPSATAKEITLLADVAPWRSRNKRVGARNDLLADRRPELYEGLLRPKGARSAR